MATKQASTRSDSKSTAETPATKQATRSRRIVKADPAPLSAGPAESASSSCVSHWGVKADHVGWRRLVEQDDWEFKILLQGRDETRVCDPKGQDLESMIAAVVQMFEEGEEVEGDYAVWRACQIYAVIRVDGDGRILVTRLPAL